MAATMAVMDSFVPAPAAAAAAVDRTDVQVWHLPYRHGDGRRPLRRLLAACLEVDAGMLAFEHGEHGRPRLADPHADLDFSWSHSGESAMLAMAHGLPELGVDLERIRRRARAVDLARRYFADVEQAALRRLSGNALDEGFLALWTAKEAVLKGTGRGLAYGLHRIAFELDGAIARPWRFDGDAGPASDWTMTPLRPGTSLLGALAWRGACRAVRRFSLEE